MSEEEFPFQPTGVTVDDRKGWLERRRALVTASDVGAIMGEDPYRSIEDCFADKMHPKTEEKLELDDPRFWGNVFEQPMLSAVAGHYGWDYRKGGELLVSTKHPIMGATLDAEIDRHDGKGWINFEGKTTELLGTYHQETEDMPPRVILQVQSQMIVHGGDVSVVFALLRRNQPVEVELHANEKLQKIIVEYSERFMELVKAGTPPIPNGTKRDAQALARIWPEGNGFGVKLPPEAVEWTRELKELAKAKKELESRETELKNLIRLCIGPTTYGVLPEPVDDTVVWRWQHQNRSGYVVAPTTSRVLLNMKKEPPEGVALLDAGIEYKELLARSSLLKPEKQES